MVEDHLKFKTFDATDKAILVREISMRSGVAISERESEKRLDHDVTTLKAQSESAHRHRILISLLTSDSLLVSATGTWLIATMGNKYRNEGIDHSLSTR